MKYCDIKRTGRRLRKNQTPEERFLWEYLKERRLEGFRFLRQHPLFYDRQGNDVRFFVPDFYCARAKLIIELDGAVHNSQQAKCHDAWRDEILQSKGLTVLRFKNDDLRDIKSVIETIRREVTHPIPLPDFQGGAGGGFFK